MTTDSRYASLGWWTQGGQNVPELEILNCARLGKRGELAAARILAELGELQALMPIEPRQIFKTGFPVLIHSAPTDCSTKLGLLHAFSSVVGSKCIVLHALMISPDQAEERQEAISTALSRARQWINYCQRKQTLGSPKPRDFRSFLYEIREERYAGTVVQLRT